MLAETPDQKIAEIRNEFQSLSKQDRLLLLLEYSEALAELPTEYKDHPDLLERVLECQSPVYIFVDLDQNNLVQFHATAPEEAPTTRGFASIIQSVVTGMPAEAVLKIPNDFPNTIGLTESVSLLRIRGMIGMLSRTKRKITEALAAK